MLPRLSGPTHQLICQQQIRGFNSDGTVFSRSSSHQGEDGQVSLANVLEQEIQEETAELNQQLSSDQFPGFSIETDDSDVKLTKQIGNTTVIVRFTVSSSLTEWRNENPEQGQSKDQSEDPQDNANYSLLSLPEFQVQICRDGRTLEVSCFFEDLEHDEETGEPFAMDPVFSVDELVVYEGEPRETEFAVSAEYLRDEVQDGLLQYMAEHGIDDEFSKNLVSFATNYEKKQYIGLMKRLKDFVSK